MTAKIQDLLYDKYGKDIQLTPVKSGTNKEIYIITTQNDKFIILINKKKSLAKEYRAIMSNNLQKNLSLHGFNAPDVIDIFKIDGKTAYCHSYIEGHTVDKLDSKTAYLMGKTVSEFHVAANLPPIISPSFSLLYRGIYLLKKSKTFMHNLCRRLSEPEWKNLPKGICHYDLNHNNFIFNNEKVFLIDYDRYRYWPYAYELARFLRNEENRKFADDFLQGYDSVRKLSNAEKKFLQECKY